MAMSVAHSRLLLQDSVFNGDFKAKRGIGMNNTFIFLSFVYVTFKFKTWKVLASIKLHKLILVLDYVPDSVKT